MRIKIKKCKIEFSDPRDPPVPVLLPCPPLASLFLNSCPSVNSTLVSPVAQAYTLRATTIYLFLSTLSPSAIQACWNKSSLLCALWNLMTSVQILPLPLPVWLWKSCFTSLVFCLSEDLPGDHMTVNVQCFIQYQLLPVLLLNLSLSLHLDWYYCHLLPTGSAHCHLFHCSNPFPLYASTFSTLQPE